MSDCARDLAATAIATPHLFPEWHEWRGRLEEFERAKDALASAESKWLKRIDPALADPLLKALAVRNSLLPNAEISGE